MINFNSSSGSTPLDPEEMEGLKLKYITTHDDLNRWEQENIQDAVSWLSRKRKSDILSEKFITMLHKKMFGKVWVWAGKFRQTNKNIGVDWISIPMELRQLIDDSKYWIDHQIFPPDEIAYRFHHKLVWIHIFTNGNGRHSRMMTDLILKEQFKLNPFTWGSGELATKGDTRKKYIEALKEADYQSFTLLKNFVRT